MPNSITATKSRMSGESALPPWGQDLVGPSPLESKAGGHAHPHIWSAPDCRRWWSAKSCQKTGNQSRVTKASRRSPRMGGYDRTIRRRSATSCGLEWDADAIHTMEVSLFDVRPMVICVVAMGIHGSSLFIA